MSVNARAAAEGAAHAPVFVVRDPGGVAGLEEDVGAAGDSRPARRWWCHGVGEGVADDEGDVAAAHSPWRVRGRRYVRRPQEGLGGGGEGVHGQRHVHAGDGGGRYLMRVCFREGWRPGKKGGNKRLPQRTRHSAVTRQLSQSTKRLDASKRQRGCRCDVAAGYVTLATQRAPRPP